MVHTALIQIKRIFRHLLESNSSDRRIAVGFVLVSFFVMVGKLAGAAKEIAIAWRYGVCETVDAYVFVFNIITWPVSVWFSLLTVIVVPLAAHVRTKNPSALPQFRSELFGLSLMVGVVLLVLSYALFPAIIYKGWAGGLGGQEVVMTMSSRLNVIVFLGVLISYFSAWYLACGRHRNTLLESVPALIILAFLISPEGVIAEPLVLGTVLGFFCHLLFLAYPLIVNKELQLPRFNFKSKEWPDFWRGFWIIAVGQIAMGFTGVIDQFFAAGLTAGSISTLNYANRILSLILSMCALAISRSTLLIFSEVSAAGVSDIVKITARWGIYAFIAGLLILGIGWITAPGIVRLLFERGAFNSENTILVSLVLQYGLLQIPFYLMGIVFYSSNSGQKKYYCNSIAMVIAVVVKIASMFVLCAEFGLIGLQVSTMVMYATFSFILVISRRNVR